MRLAGSLPLRTAAVALAGVGAGLSFAPYHWVYLLPVAIAVVSCACAGLRLRSGFWLGSVFGTAFMLVLLPWIQVISAFAWVPLALLEGLFYGLAGLTTSALTRRGARLGGWPVWAACSWVLVELLRGTVPFGGFPWGRLAFAVEDTPLAPALAYVGAPGIAFLVALLGTTLAWVVLGAPLSLAARTRGTRRLEGRPGWRRVLVLCAVAALASSASVFPWRTTSPDDRVVTIAAVQGNVPGKGLEAFAERRAVLDNHVRATQDLAARVKAGRAPQPDLVVWPENSSDIDPYTDLDAQTAIGGAAAAVGAPLLMGAVVGDRVDAGWRNRAIVWSTDGRPGATYDKTHPVPFGEYIPLRSLVYPLVPALSAIPSDLIRGTRPGVLQVGPARVGVLMCFEVAYDGLLRDLVDGGADVIVVPTNNATYTGTGQIEQQFAMSRMRAIETGRYVVVASTNGISGIVAPDGSVQARAPQQEQAVLEERVALIERRTPATVLGAVPELVLSGAGLAALLVALGLRRRAHAGAGGAAGARRPGSGVDRAADPETAPAGAGSR